MLNAVARYFDLFADYRPTGAKAQAAAGSKLDAWRQWAIYLASVLGVLLGPFVPAALTGAAPPLAAAFTDLNQLLWGAVLALAMFPAIYKVVLSPKVPLLAQMGTGLVAGFLARKIVPKAIEVVGKLFGA